jgi:RNA polymerase sigma-70 factor, ECF subfamily
MIGVKAHNRIKYHDLQHCAASFMAGIWVIAQHMIARVRGVFIGMGQLSLAEISDSALIEVCQTRGAKDDRPFQELFRRYQSVVWRVCYSTMRNRQDAEDLTQEVFFKVYRSLHQFEGRSAFKTWVYRVAINSCQNEIRRRSRRPQEAETEMEVIAEIMPSGKSVEKEYQEKYKRELLAQALANLEPGVSEVLYMKDMEERPYHEIANLLQIGVSAAKMRVQRARLALQIQYRLLASDS